MQVRLAKTAGFCMGVRLAMDKVLTIAEQGRGAVYTYGPLIHNRQAVEMLEGKGVRDLSGCPGASGGTVLIRAHGVPRAEADALAERGFEVVDATCPRVIASQQRIQRCAARGCRIVIAGDKDHAEVAGLVSRAPGACVVVSTVDEARTVDVGEPVCLIAQTTFSEKLYDKIAAVLRERFPGIEVIQSICQATRQRQEEVVELAAEVDAMVVVGGLHSANTRRLAELARSTGKPTFHVETAQDLDVGALSEFAVVGLTAGASTPNWVTRSVLQALEDIGRPVPLGEWLPWRAFAAVTRSNLYSAAAAAAITYASSVLVGIAEPKAEFLLAAFCYVFAVTTLNRVTRSEGEEQYLPPRVAFYRRHARPLLALSFLFAAASLLSLLIIEAWPAMALLVAAYLLGVAYSVRLVPKAWLSKVRYARLKDLPASKDLFVALAWVVVCVLLPWLEHDGTVSVALGVVCLFVFVLSFVKATVVDLADMQEDHLLGRETLPIILGERKTTRLLVRLTLGLAVVLAGAAALGWVSSLGWLMLGCVAYVVATLRLFLRWVVASDILCALVTDGVLLLAGLLALIWTVL